MKLSVQSVRISKKISKERADEMVRKMGFKATKPDPIKNPQYKNYHSYRQLQPAKFVPKSFRVKKQGDTLLILGFLK